MRVFPWVVSALLIAAIGLSWTTRAQDGVEEPKIVIAPGAKIPPISRIASINFGATCHSSPNPPTHDNRSGVHSADRRSTVAETMGAPITAITIDNYGEWRKSSGDVQDRARKVVASQMRERAACVEWDEAVLVDIVGTVQFADKRVGAFEQSAERVCFTDNDGAAVFTRIRLEKNQ